MNTYEFITPSDPITFKAANDKIAYATALLVGNGKAGCHRLDSKEDANLQTILMFSPNAEELIKETLGMSLDEFIDNNLPEVIAALNSFCYGSAEDRRTYDDAVNAITEPEKLKEFRKKHEDRNRSSMSAFVKYAWRAAELIEKKEASHA